jgi:hypothetical protein
MSSAAPTIVFLSAEDLDQLRVCIKSRPLQEKLSALKNPHGATLMTATINPTQRLLSMFEGTAKEKLSLYLKDPTQSVNFNDIRSIPLKRDQRREVHNLIRQVSKDKLDSDLDNETSRINIFVRSTATQPHKQQNQGPRQQNPKQQRGPARATPYRNTNNNRNATSRNKLATRGVAAPRASPPAHLTVEQLAKKFAGKEKAAQPTVSKEAASAEKVTRSTAHTEAAPVEAPAEHCDAPPVEGVTHHKLHNATVDETFKLRTPKNKKPELTAEEIAEREERRKNVVPPHMRGTASQSNMDE